MLRTWLRLLAGGEEEGIATELRPQEEEGGIKKVVFTWDLSCWWDPINRSYEGNLKPSGGDMPERAAQELLGL